MKKRENPIYEEFICKNDKRHLKKIADCYALFSTYSAIWTLNTFSQNKPVLPTFKASRVHDLLQKQTSALVVF